MIYQPRADHRICVIGVPGQGKSVWRNSYLREIYRATLWNPLGDYQLGEVVSVDEYRQRIKLLRRGNIHLTVEPTDYDEDVMREEFDALCAYAEEIGAQHLAIEEIGLVATPSRVPPYFNRLAIRGRHRGISLSTYGQRFHQFPLIARGTACELIAFRQTDTDDVRDFNRRIAPRTSPMPINELPDFHYLRWTPATGVTLHKPLPFRKSE
jgi:hypothetical protein